MTRQRRSHLLILALVPVVVFAAVRCADATSPAPAPKPSAASSDAAVATRIAKLRQETDWVGKFHNDALAYVYAGISRLPARARDKRTVCETARRSYAEFHRARLGKPVPQNVDAEMEQFCATGAPPAAHAQVVSATPGTARREISPEAQSLMEQIATEVDASTSYSDLDSRVSAIEATAASTLSYEDAQGVFAVGSVARSSSVYWANNVTSWVAVSNTPDYSVLASRATLTGPGATPILYDFDWDDFANKVWNDAKKAAKRAGGGDIRATAKFIVGSAIAEVPVIWEALVASAAAGSIMAVLQL